MARNTLFALVAVLVSAGIPAVASAEEPWTASASFLGAVPVGDFADATDFGSGVTASATRWRGHTPLGLRLEFGGVVYGSQELRSDSGPYALTTSADNWFATMQAGPEIARRSGRLRPYAFATAGASYFATSFETTTDIGTSVRSDVTYDSWTFAARAGAGLQAPLGRHTTLDVGARYLYNADVKYLAKGDVLFRDGASFERPRKSSVELAEFIAGIRFDF